MTSVKCPACGLVDWNVGDCKRCGTSLVGLDADGRDHGGGYFPEQFEGRSVGAARAVVAVCALFAVGLSALGILYLAHKPSKPQWFWSFYRNNPTPNEIFAHNLEVTGGAARARKLRSFKAEGKITFTDGETAQMVRAAGGVVTLVMHAREPNKVETEIEIGAAGESATPFPTPPPSLSNFFHPAAPKVRVTIRRGFDGARGWEYVERTILTPGSTVPIKQHNTRELLGEELEQVKRSSIMDITPAEGEYAGVRLVERVPVTWGTQGQAFPTGVVLVDEELRGHEAYVVSGVNKEGKEEKLYFDTLTGLLLRADFGEVKVGDETVQMDCVFGDYKEVGGLKLPHRFYFNDGEESRSVTVEKYLPNEPIPDSTFEMPE